MSSRFWFAAQRLYEQARHYEVAAYYQLYQEAGRWSVEQLAAYQERKLGETLRLAVDRVPFYRERASGQQLLIDDHTPGENLSRFPLMTKQDYRADVSRFAGSSDTSCFLLNHTGGSTGEVFHFYQDNDYQSGSWASIRYFDSWSGYTPGDRRSSIWGASIEAGFQGRLKTRLINRLYRTLFISTYSLDPATIAAKVAALKRFQPTMVHGYPTSMSVFARYAIDHGIRIDSLRGVITSAETLFPWQRELIETAFGVPVFNRYGCREFSTLAMECGCHRGLHLDAIRNYYEFLPLHDDLYEIVVTQLTNRAMPLIRYRTGDIARLPQTGRPFDCDCSLPLPCILGVEGRTFDLIHGREGEVVTGTFWTLLLRSRPGTVQFQVHQRSYESIEIKLVTDSAWQQETEEYYRSSIQAQFHYPVEITFSFPESIPASASGKHRFVVSDLAGNPR